MLLHLPEEDVELLGITTVYLSPPYPPLLLFSLLLFLIPALPFVFVLFWFQEQIRTHLNSSSSGESDCVSVLRGQGAAVQGPRHSWRVRPPRHSQDCVAHRYSHPFVSSPSLYHLAPLPLSITGLFAAPCKIPRCGWACTTVLVEQDGKQVCSPSSFSLRSLPLLSFSFYSSL